MAKIILAEDDSTTVEIYQKKFEDARFEVIVASTGKDALRCAAKENADVMLLDLVLPEMGGLDVLKEIKKSGKYNPGLKVIIFSNLDSEEEKSSAFRYGVDGFIPKTKYTPSELVEEVKKIIGNINH
ncbi:response regulator [bacterium]|nr:response regulator [bacterium]